MVRLVRVVEQALVARLAAAVGRAVLEGVRVVVAECQGPARQRRHHGRIVDELTEDAGPTFRYLVEEDLLPIPARRHRLARQLARLELEVLLDRLLERGLKTRGLGPGTRRFEAHGPGRSWCP